MTGYLSPPQRDALRAVVVEALASVPAGVPEVPAASVVWGPVDHGELDAPWVVLREIAAEAVGVGDDEQTTEDTGGGTFTTRMREQFEVSVEVQVAVSRDDAAPTHAQDAGVLLRRLAVRLLGSRADATLTAAGCPVMRRGGLRDLTVAGPGASQWQTRGALDLVLGIEVIESDVVDVVTAVSGEVDLAAASGETIVAPFTTE